MERFPLNFVIAGYQQRSTFSYVSNYSPDANRGTILLNRSRMVLGSELL